VKRGGRRSLVTGGAGFNGSHLVERLASDGWEVRVLDDLSSGREENLDAVCGSVELLRGDLLDGDLLDRALAGVDVIFHHAAIPSVPRSLAEPLRTHEVNLTGTLRLLAAARRAVARRVVFASSCAVYGDARSLPLCEAAEPQPLSPYALQKVAAEGYCRAYAGHLGLETVALRYFNVFGPRQDPESEYSAVIPRFASAALCGAAARVFGDGEQSRDFVFVDDVVTANLLAADAPRANGQAINVGSGRATSLNTLLAMLRKQSPTTAAPSHEASRAGDIRESVADVSRAREILAWTPETGLEDGLARTLEYLGKRHEGRMTP
jgi:UDP-glucose 4-epimerase